MEKTAVIDRIRAHGLVAVIRADSPQAALALALACRSGGTEAIELTCTVPRPLEALRLIRAHAAFDGCLVGAGTVLDPETARLAILEGADFVVAPCFAADTVRLCHRYRVPVLPGAGSLAEILACLEAGVDLIKLFPGELLGPAFLRAARGPLPQALLVPSGGVSAENAADWLAVGAAALSAGGSLTAPGRNGDYAAVAARTAALLAAIRAARADAGATPA